MKNARDRAEEFLDRYFCDKHDESDIDTLEIYFKECEEEQHKLTRHACADACIEHADAPAINMISRCHNSCMNVKAV